MEQGGLGLVLLPGRTPFLVIQRSSLLAASRLLLGKGNVRDPQQPNARGHLLPLPHIVVPWQGGRQGGRHGM